MRKFTLTALLALALVGSLAVTSAEAQWRRTTSFYYPSYTPYQTYYNPGYVTYSYPSTQYYYTPPTYYPTTPGYTSYYYTPQATYYTSPQPTTYYGPTYYYDAGWRRWWR
jgi:hypothetical protein